MSMNLAGFKIGHATDKEHHTGCTVLLCPEKTVGSVDVRGPAPGSREAALLASDKRTIFVNGVVLTGGSAFGLVTADGVMRYLSERGIGHYTPIRPVPIVPAAVVYDLFMGDGKFLPSSDMGYQACLAASDKEIPQGNVGAGAGVTVGKWVKKPNVMKGGFGLASMDLGDLVVGAAAVVNSVGDVVASDGTVLAGARKVDGTWLVEENPLRYVPEEKFFQPGMNTTLIALFTNALLDKAQVNRLAKRVHDGIAIAIRPAHTFHDGDTAFALATGKVEADYDLIANVADQVVAESIRNGVRNAATVNGVPGLNDET